METEKDDVIECIIDDMGVYGEGITHVVQSFAALPVFQTMRRLQFAARGLRRTVATEKRYCDKCIQKVCRDNRRGGRYRAEPGIRLSQ